MAPDNRAGLVQEMNDALCNQICKGDLARRMHTDKWLLRLDMALRTLIFKLWGSLKISRRGKGHTASIYLNQRQYWQRHRPNTKSKYWRIIYANELVLLSLWSYGSLLNTVRVQYCGYCKLQTASVNAFARERQRRHVTALETWVLLAGVLLLAAGFSRAEEACRLRCTHVSNRPAT